MLCPNCQIKLTASERAGVEMEYCSQCHGVWLECGCLDKIIDRSLDESIDTPLVDTDQPTPYDRLAYADRGRIVTVNLYDTTA